MSGSFASYRSVISCVLLDRSRVPFHERILVITYVNVAQGIANRFDFEIIEQVCFAMYLDALDFAFKALSSVPWNFKIVEA